MSRCLEKETRAMISQEEYVSICGDLFKEYPRSMFITNTNYYFDTEDFAFTDMHHMIRIRNVGHNYELTYKVKGDNGDLEINQDISNRLAHKYLTKGSLPHGEVYNAVASTGISPKKLKVITSLYTRRLEIDCGDYLFVLDMNSYDGVEDYNIEIESKKSIEHATEVLKRYCKQYHLTYPEHYEVKSARAIKLAREKSHL